MWIIKWLFSPTSYFNDVTKIHNEYLKRQKVEALRKDLVLCIKRYCDGVWAGPIFAEIEWKKVLTALRELDKVEEQENFIAQDKCISLVPTTPVRR